MHLRAAHSSAILIRQRECGRSNCTYPGADIRSGEAIGTGLKSAPEGEPGSIVSAMDQRVEPGRAIAEQRRRHGLSQSELAGLLGWARNIAVRLAATGGSRDTGFGPAQIALYEIAVSVETSSPRGPRPTGDGAGPGQLHRAS